MATYAGGTFVKNGYYLGLGKWTVASVPGRGSTLPGSASDRYLRVPAPLLWAAAPVVGGAMVVMLPAIGFGLAFYAAGKALMGGVKKSAADLAATVATPQVPGEAHLTGRSGAAEPPAGAPKEPAAGAELDGLGREIDSRRKDEK